jgi:hypothetical protein
MALRVIEFPISPYRANARYGEKLRSLKKVKSLKFLPLNE